MFVVSMAMFAVLSALDPADPSILIQQLGSARYAQREAAEASLVRQGAGVVPALRVARDSRDPEIRARSAAILSRIEDGMLTQPTMVSLDFRGVTLAEAIATIRGKTGLDLVMTPQDHPAWTNTKLDRRSNGPMPFWTAIDALCEAGHIHYEFGAPAPHSRGECVFPLYPGDAAFARLFSDSGPFRVQLASIHSQSDLLLSRNLPATGPRPGSNDDANGRGPTSAQRQFYLQVVVAAEPRLTIAQAGPARVTEALDNRGNSLLAPVGQDLIQRSSGYLGISASPSLQVRVDLARPDPSAEQISLLKGEVPVVVSSRKPGPVTTPLSEVVGKTFPDDAATFTVEAVHVPGVTQATSIEISIRPSQSRVATAGGPDGARLRREADPRQVEVLDARGEVLPWFLANTSYDGETTRTTLSILARGEFVPAALRFHEISRASVDVPFEFRGVAMP